MFVRSRLSKDIVYRKRGKSWVIKAGTVTYIDENQVTAKELRELYSTRIEIISMDKLESMEINIPVKEEVKKEEIKKVQIEKSKPVISNTKPVVTKKHKEDDVIDRLLAEIKDEVKIEAKEEPIVRVIDEPAKEGFMTGIGTIIIPSEVQDYVQTPVELEEGGNNEPVHAGADLKIELDAVQPVEVKQEEPVMETGKEIPVLKDEEKEKPKRGRKTSTAKKSTGKKRGRKKSTAK